MEPQITINTPTPESLPTGPVMAGTPITYDGWSMTVSKDIRFNPTTWGLTIYVRNTEEFDRVFRFTNSAVQAQDDLGHVYNYDKYSYCEEYHHQVKNLQIKAEQSKTISSSSPGVRENNCNQPGGINRFEGPIPLEASKLIIRFDNFGPFTGVEVIIDL
jgi:hypothetical protein